MNVALLYGGHSAEHTVSVHSAGTIAQTLKALHHQVYPIAITLDGRWFLEDTVSEQIDEGREVTIRPGKGLWLESGQLPIDAAFPVTHGHQGEDGALQGLLELSGLPYTGCDQLASSVMMFKDVAQRLFSTSGIPTVPTHVIGPTDPIILSDAQEACGSDALFVKPEDGGSSIGCTALENPTEESFKEAVGLAFHYGERVLAQPYLKDVREIECAALELMDGYVLVSPPGMVVNPNAETLLSYETKYRLTGGDVMLTPAPVPKEIAALTETYTKAAFKVSKAHGYFRADYFLTQDGKLLLNEINSLPGMTATSHYPKLISQCGYTLSDVVDILLHDAQKVRRAELKRTYLPPKN